ncbi:MAG: hypothetical protein ABJC19_07775 [Gemmatimonadota bacterium]
MSRSLLGRATRIILRLAGWLLTPVVLTITAALGATIAAVVALRLAPTAAVVTMLIGGLAGALLGLLGWERLLRGSPELRAVLAVTAEGVPEPAVVEELIAESESPAEPPA